jgi:hypothetical protein
VRGYEVEEPWKMPLGGCALDVCFTAKGLFFFFFFSYVALDGCEIRNAGSYFVFKDEETYGDRLRRRNP